jgi:HlyD family secretion protein
MKRWLWIVGGCAVVIAGIVWGMRKQPVQVEPAKVTTGPLRVTVEEEGKTRLKSRYVVSAPVTGFMSRLSLKAGDPVKAGQVLTRLSSTSAPFLDVRTQETGSARVQVAQTALEVAESRIHTLEEQLRSAQVDLDYWTRERDRQQVLVKSGDLPSQRLDETNAQIKRAEAAVAAAKANIATANMQIDNAQAEVNAARAALRPASAPGRGGSGESIPVVIPASGRVIRVIQESEAVVNPGTPLIEVGNANAIEVEVEVLSQDAVQMMPGTRVLLTGWGGDGELEARVRVIEPGGFTKISALGVEEQRVRVIADITSPEDRWKKLGDGYRVEASFVLWESDKVLQVPANALFRQDGGWSVFVIENGVARRRAVEVGHRSGLAAEILKGLNEGDTVVAHPDETVEDGKEVVAK